MFTGITQGLFTVTDAQRKQGLLIYRVKLNPALTQGLVVGSSVAVDGVCQTVVAIVADEVTFEAIEETCSKTTLGLLQTGQHVSIERSATYGAEIGGHVMSGHVFGMGKVLARNPWENNLELTIQCAPEMMEYVFVKGFIGINGSSLTINHVDLAHHTIAVNLIPHTLTITDLGNKHPGDQVNIELDSQTVTIVETLKRLPIIKNK